MKIRISIRSQIGQALQRAATLQDYTWTLALGEHRYDVADVTVAIERAKYAIRLGLVESVDGTRPRWDRIVRWSAKGREAAARALLTDKFIEVDVEVDDAV